MRVKIQHTPQKTDSAVRVIIAIRSLCELQWNCQPRCVAKNFARNDSATNCECVTLQNEKLQLSDTTFYSGAKR